MTDARRANAAALAVILLAGALSTLWAFLVPIFQAPDEPAHFDYAISIYNAHRLVRVSDGKPDWIVSPYTKYLLNAVDFDRIAMNSSMRAPSGYGTRTFFSRLDARAPSLSPSLPSSARINYIVPSYPFGFYALEALWMHAVSFFTGSLAGVFFSARLLCVFLTMAGLYFSYRTALNLGLPPWTCVALVAAVGLLPITSFVSSYVQPDNLAFALLSAALFFATLRADRLALSRVAGMGITLGMLAVTKYHFFLVAAIALSLLFVAQLLRSRLSIARRAGAIAAFAAPTIALLSVQHWVIASPGAAASPALTSSLEYLRSTLALGPGAVSHYLFLASARAFTDLFISGPCAATFWQVFGWGDTPIFIVNAAAELWIRAVISLITVAVAVVLLFGLGRTTIRALRITARGQGRSALGLLASDPVLNSYLLFVVFMFGLYVLTNNAYGAEGRHWYPFVFVALLCLVWYAPRMLSRRQKGVSTVLACALLCYAVVAAGFALGDVAQRYYGPPVIVATRTKPASSQVLPQPAIGNLWRVKSAQYHLSDAANPVFPVGSKLIVVGVALPNSSGPSAVAAVVDGRWAIPVSSGEYQFVIAEASHDPAKAYGQFSGSLATSHLGEGPHWVTAYSALPDGRHYEMISPVRLFFLAGADGEFSTRFTRSLARAATLPGSLGVAGTCVGAYPVEDSGRAVEAGSLLYLTGRIPKADARAYAAAWLLVDRSPYPARYNPAGGYFVATVPTENLAIGKHRAFAFAMRQGSAGLVRLAESAPFRIVAGAGARRFLADPPPGCSDPMHQLASIQ